MASFIGCINSPPIWKQPQFLPLAKSSSTLCEPDLILHGVEVLLFATADELFLLDGAEPPLATFTEDGEPAATGPLAEVAFLLAATAFAFDPKVLGAEGITFPVTPLITTIWPLRFEYPEINSAPDTP